MLRGQQRNTLLLKHIVTLASLLTVAVPLSLAAHHRTSTQNHLASCPMAVADRVVKIKGEGVVHANNNQATVFREMLCSMTVINTDVT